MSTTTKSNKATKPLSAYNIFFQYNRFKLLSSIDEMDAMIQPPEDACPPGLEDVGPDAPILQANEAEIRQYRKQIIEQTIENIPMNNSYKKTSAGPMSFLEMSHYMSKKWKKSDETTKNIFRQLSNEQKAKHQKLQFDSYKKAAKRFSFASTASSTSIDETTARRVSLEDYDKSSTTFKPKYEMIKTNTSMKNAVCEEIKPLMKPKTVPEKKLFRAQPSVFPHYPHNSQHYNASNDLFVGAHYIPVRNNQVARRQNRNKDEEELNENLSTFGWKDHSKEENDDKIISAFKPLPYIIGSNEEMSYDELRDWLANLNWSQL